MIFDVPLAWQRSTTQQASGQTLCTRHCREYPCWRSADCWRWWIRTQLQDRTRHLQIQRQGGPLGRAGPEVRHHNERVRCGALQRPLEIAGGSEVEVDMNEVVWSNIMERSMDNPTSDRSSTDHAPVGSGRQRAQSLETHEQAIRPEDDT